MNTPYYKCALAGPFLVFLAPEEASGLQQSETSATRANQEVTSPTLRSMHKQKSALAQA